MENILIVVHLLITLALIGVVLMQRSEGGALGIGGGSGNLFSSRGVGNALTRTTAILAVCFFASSIALAVLATRERGPSFAPVPANQTDRPAGTNDTPPANGGGSLLPKLDGMGGQPVQPAPGN
jgi:preprotein translocase subunit SecG